MVKIEEIKQAIKNPPADRLAKIEYQSHALQAIGIIAVCIMLIYKGFWYIIFALIFGVGISYSQGMTAYAKYKAIKSLQPKERLEDYEKDISWTRRRSKIIQSSLGGFAHWVSLIFGVLCAFVLIDPRDSRILLTIYYPITIALGYFIMYFIVSYHIAYPWYKEKIENLPQKKKEVKKNGRR